jgi:hypothetical protein
MPKKKNCLVVSKIINQVELNARLYHLFSELSEIQDEEGEIRVDLRMLETDVFNAVGGAINEGKDVLSTGAPGAMGTNLRAFA